MRKIPGFVGCDEDEEEEGWKLFITDKPPQNIKEKRNDNNNGASEMAGVQHLPPIVEVEVH